MKTDQTTANVHVPILRGVKVVLCAGTSWFILNFCRGLIWRLQSHGASVICLAPKDPASKVLREELHVDLEHWVLDGNSSNPLRELRGFVQAYRFLRKIRPHFVFNFTVKSNVYGGTACRLQRVAYANTVTGLGMRIGSSGGLAALMRALSRLANTRARTVFVLNPDDLDFLQSHGVLGHAPSELLAGAGVDLTAFAPQEVAAPPVTFLMLARIQAEKGVREFIEASRKTKWRHPGARFILLGSTDLTNRSSIPASELEQWRREGFVEIHDAVEDVRPWLKIAHALVLPSYREGMPRSVQEAAACARPVIVSDVPGCRHAVIHGQTGFIHPPKDAAALAEAMEKIISMSPEELSRMGRNARQLAEERFSEERVVDAYLACVAQCGASPGENKA